MAVDIESAPEFEEIPVTDVEFGYAFGGLTQWTLFPEDELTIMDKSFVIEFGNGMRAEVHKANVAFWTRKDRILRRRITKAPASVRRLGAVIDADFPLGERVGG